MIFGIQFNTNYGPVTGSQLTPYSCIATERVTFSLSGQSLNETRTFNYGYFPSGTKLIVNVFPSVTYGGGLYEYEKGVWANATVSGGNVTVNFRADYDQFQRWIEYTVYVYADYSGASDGSYGISFMSGGVMACYTAEKPPLCLKHRQSGGMGSGSREVTINTNVSYSSRSNVYVGLSVDDPVYAKIENNGGKIRVRIKRMPSCWKSSRYSLAPLNSCTWWLLVFAPWGGVASGEYGFALCKSDGQISWASNEKPEIASGWINQPTIKNNSSQTTTGSGEEIYFVNTKTIPTSHRNKDILFNPCARGHLITGNYLKESECWQTYNKETGRFSLAREPLQQSGEYIIGPSNAQLGNTMSAMVPYMVVDDWF